MTLKENRRCIVIAEAGVNHNGSLELAHRLIDAAADSGADIVKFQSFKADKLVTGSAPKAGYQVRNTSDDESHFDMLSALELSEKAHRELLQHCGERDIEFLSSPFDLDSLKFLVELGVKKIKLGSGELTNAPMLLAVSRTKLPLILSTGMSTLSEVERALGVLAFGYSASNISPSTSAFETAWTNQGMRRAAKKNVSLLHCTTEYPAPRGEINLRAIKTLREAFGVACGYSDHTVGYAVSIAAVALGATIIEKHFTLDKSLHGPDHKASLEPESLKGLVDHLREVEESLGDGIKTPMGSEIPNKIVARKSLVAAKNIAKGRIITEEDVAVKRPGSGLNPLNYWDIIGTRAVVDFSPDDLLVLCDESDVTK